MPSEPNVIPMSITTFYTGALDPSKGSSKEEMILLYSEGFEYGPCIERDGMGEPWMWMGEHNQPVRKVTHPIEQRRGTWLIDANEAKKIEIDLIKQDGAIDEQTKRRWIEELDQTPNYFDVFKERYPDHEILAMQGCGNLTMNDWFVAYLNSAFTSGKPVFCFLATDLKRFPELKS
jgi:hypothetical protein